VLGESGIQVATVAVALEANIRGTEQNLRIKHERKNFAQKLNFMERD
jgi:hypothetical protein